jgi:hypothetical protein
MVTKLKTKNDGKNQKYFPTWCTKCRSGFTTLPPVLLQGPPTVVLLLERVLVFWSLAMDEHEDLYSLDRQSIIPYVKGRMELHCSSLALRV